MLAGSKGAPAANHGQPAEASGHRPQAEQGAWRASMRFNGLPLPLPRLSAFEPARKLHWIAFGLRHFRPRVRRASERRKGFLPSPSILAPLSTSTHPAPPSFVPTTPIAPRIYTAAPSISSVASCCCETTTTCRHHRRSSTSNALHPVPRLDTPAHLIAPIQSRHPPPVLPTILYRLSAHLPAPLQPWTTRLVTAGARPPPLHRHAPTS